MRKVILSAGMSLDGYIARPNGAVDFLFMPKDCSKGSFFKKVGTALMGRKTYEAALQMKGGAFDRTMAYYVFSRGLPPGKRDGVVFTNQPPAAMVAELRGQNGTDIWLMGGGELAREFLRADLVDELHLGIVPVLLGEGIPLFPNGYPQRSFELLENESYSQGLVALMYARVRST